MPRLFSRYPLVLTLLPILAGLLVSWLVAGRLAEQRAWQARSDEARGQLQLYAQTLHTLVERFRSVPALLAQDSDIQALLRTPAAPVARATLNLRLERLNRAAGSTVLYLLDRQGEAIAASNWREAGSFIGNNYAFRPYFQEAFRAGGGRYFAVGVTTGVPGYFLSHAVRDDTGAVLGVLVVKLEFEALQQDWQRQPDVLLVSDEQAVVILANRPDWRFRALEVLAEPVQRQVLNTRQYPAQALRPLTSRVLAQLDDSAQRRRVEGPQGRQDYLWQRLLLPDEGWTLHLLMSPAVLNDSVRSYRLAAAGIWMTLAFFGLFLLQLRQNQRLQSGIRERLELEVAARTAELRAAQEGLVQAAKMAALGQMSAALAHELNQPLTALQMHLGSLRLLLDSGRQAEVREGLGRVEALLQRMALLSGRLKTFARKSPAGLRERLSLDGVLEQTLQLLGPRLRAEQVTLRREVDPLAQVLGDGIRLEQVLLNLLNNALDAMARVEHRQLTIDLQALPGEWLLSIGDTGGGIAVDHLGRVFEPFFTTKPVGQGLGLGLAVSFGIVHELGGRLEAGNTLEGAVFRLYLPAAPAA